jgi:hypothetical protein
MKRSQPPRKLSLKKLKSLGGRVPYSSITKKPKALKKVNPIAKAKRDKRYKAHLSSAYWKALRRKVWGRTWVAGEHCCEACGLILESISDMQLAHLTYARFGKELDTDVQGQCRQCNESEAALRGKRIRRTA